MTDQNDAVLRYLHAMQRGADGEDELVSLFAEDGEYIESFGGEPRSHRGRDAIRRWLRTSWEHQPPEIKLSADRVEAHGDVVTLDWTCESAAFTRPSRGTDTYTIRDGLIVRLETAITQPPVLR